jgi:hypothetical protein
VSRLVLEWVGRDVERLRSRLAGLGFQIRAGTLRFPGADVRIVGSSPVERLREVPGPGPSTIVADELDPHPNGVADLLAVGWATVDAERVTAAAAGSSQGRFEPAPDDVHLGSRSFLLHPRPGSSGPRTLVLEPSTEGRLAATLARVGEGPAVLYLKGGDDRLAAVEAFLRQAGTPASPLRRGPLGRSILLPGAAAGPHLIVVEEDRGPGADGFVTITE